MAERKYHLERQLTSGLTKLKATLTLVFGTKIFTSAAHGLRTGDLVYVSNTGGALPDGLLATTRYFVQVIDVDTFYLFLDSKFLSPITVADNGSGTNSFNLKSRVVSVNDFKTIGLTIHTADSCACKIFVKGSSMDDPCDFFAAQSITNRWEYLQMVALDTQVKTDGSTGLTVTGADIHNAYEINVNAVKQLCVDFTTVTAGEAEINVSPFEY